MVTSLSLSLRNSTIFPFHNISFPAHRLMMAKTSPFFENLFYGSMAIHGQEWKVNTCGSISLSFKVVLAHCYHDCFWPKAKRFMNSQNALHLQLQNKQPVSSAQFVWTSAQPLLWLSPVTMPSASNITRRLYTYNFRISNQSPVRSLPGPVHNHY